jgi:predicted permease
MILRRLLAVFQQRRLERDLQDEIAGHLALQEQEFVRQGMDPQAARAAALREFGGVAQTTEEYRERSGVPLLEAVLRGTRHACRSLARQPGFAAAAVLSLALGIGANTAIFSMFEALMLRMLPVENPRELVFVRQASAGDAGYVSPSLYLEFEQRKDLFTGVLARRGPSPTPLLDSGTARIEGVSTNFFDVLGVHAAMGRFFATDESGVAVLSYGFWQDHYGGDHSIIGKMLSTETASYRVIGVASPNFKGVEVESPADVWTPLTIRPSRNARFLWMIGRLKTGVSRAAAETALNALFENQLRAESAGVASSDVKRRLLAQRIEVRDGSIGISFLRDRFGRPLIALFGLSMLVLLATCVNIAHLLLARGAARVKEVAVRCSLGASPARLACDAMTESLLLAIAGCAAGLALAFWGGRWLLMFLPARMGHLDLAPNGTILGFAITASFLCAVLFGVGPSIRAARVDPVAGLRDAGRSSRASLRRMLVSGQVALSVLLVALSGLFVHSLVSLRGVSLGLSSSVITFWLNYPAKWSEEDQNRARTRLIAALSELPGVAAVSHSAPEVLQGGWQILARVPGDSASDRDPSLTGVYVVAPGFLSTIGARILAGRDIAPTDSAAAPRIALVNQSFERKFFGGSGRALGRTFQLTPEGKEQPFTVAGVVRDIAHRGVRRETGPQIYLPASQYEAPMSPSIALRTARPPAEALAAIRAEGARLGGGITIVQPRTVQQRLDESIFEDRLLAALSGFFGALALTLAGVGLYGLVAYTTARRTAEIGIRVALGATRLDVLWLVARDALMMVLGGLVAGFPLAVGAGRAVRSLLFGVAPGDPTVLMIAGAMLVLVGATAALLPARRAARVDPAGVLRID